MTDLRLSDIEAARWDSGDSVLLFITDRCPVGCAHCSVDSRPDSPRITDLALFEHVVDELVDSDFPMVGISGGEPFVERLGLPYAVERLADAGKHVVVYSSGFWARSELPATWICDVFSRMSSLVLSTDAFHQDSVSVDRFRNALCYATSVGVPVVVQVLDLPGERELVEPLMAEARAQSPETPVDLSLIAPLPYGRARGLVPTPRPRSAESYGPCRLARAPVIRYDGRAALCCNENVLMGAGPDYLRRSFDPTSPIGRDLRRAQSEPMLRVISRVGVGVLTQHPQAGELRETQTSGICEACWRAVTRLENSPDDPLLRALAGLASKEAAG